ncbi:hypothetical protein [Novosphingobium sp.]|uniref:hypothetical protein n=1 Tax=Novosphingobium sp. TaxID=1874826 RepID=UPI0025CE3C5A|nr:hypothetical protein [Novosphingobium sp.]
MNEPIASFDAAIAFALTLPGTKLSTSFGKPAVKVAANGQGSLFVGHEPDSSFCLRLDHGLVDILIETGPATFWQSPHYVGSAALLVRFDSSEPGPEPGPEPDRVREAIERACEIAASLPPPSTRKR